MSLPVWKTDLIEKALNADILKFGSFTLKSGRTSPYFINCGLFSKFGLSRAFNGAYARTIHEYAQKNSDFDFDVIFGPAYKGIPIAGITGNELSHLDEARWDGKGYSFNRKEAKDHGEGGTIVGESLKGKKVIIIDDVITAGTAIREAIDIIKAQGGTLAGIVVAVDRQEKTPTQAEKEGKGDDGTARASAIGEVRRETGVPVLAVLTLEDIIAGAHKLGKSDEVKQMEEYRKQYGATDA
ncbi:Putative Phosphoribosyltransferase domain-containing protein [Septoria linicola]|uniref:Orotate phosphoribosyltransferase n=1 Tax=Septoria linicola TaxID=215465 RepID=A0A9Q9EMA9_9PEZI|nr:putative Phosphoribosyltransferase domain-containing protein [Septoria linicola]USW54243.1 Putative Phosphoribosyltransferase domain-containing protein [Septoria linicola]